MANGEYVTWDKYDEHLEETKEGYQRLERLEAEVMGDKESGRPSLRSELSKRIDKSNRILISILVIILARILIDWFFVQPKISELETLRNWKIQQDEVGKEQMRWKEQQGEVKK